MKDLKQGDAQDLSHNLSTAMVMLLAWLPSHLPANKILANLHELRLGEPARSERVRKLQH